MIDAYNELCTIQSVSSNHYYLIDALNAINIGGGGTDERFELPALVQLGANVNLLAPTGLLLTVISDTQINLAWTAGDNKSEGYKIESSTDGITFTEIASQAGVTYSNTGLTRGTIVHYRVRSYKGSVYSPYSNVENDCTTIDTILATIRDRFPSSNPALFTKDVNNDVEVQNSTTAGNHYLHSWNSLNKPKWTADEGVQYDGIKERLNTFSVTNPLPISWYIVIKHDTWQLNKTLFGGAVPLQIDINSVVETPFIRCDSESLSEQVNMEVGRWVIIRIIANGANSKFQINKRYPAHFNAGTKNTAGYNFGGLANNTNFAAISQLDGIFTSTADSDEDQNSIVNYLYKLYESKLQVIPDVTEKISVCLIGDSLTIYLTPNGGHTTNFFPEQTVRNIAEGGHGISNQVTEWGKLTYSLQASFKYVFVMLGVNEHTTSATVEAFVTKYQAFINQIRIEAPNTKIIGCTMTPVRNSAQWTEGALYAKYLGMNEAIKGNGATPVTGLDGVCYLHTEDLQDENGQVLAIYDESGDHIHVNDLGRQIIANRMQEFITA